MVARNVTGLQIESQGIGRVSVRVSVNGPSAQKPQAVPMAREIQAYLDLLPISSMTIYSVPSIIQSILFYKVISILPSIHYS